VTVLDRLSTGGSRANLEAHEGDPRLRLVLGDVVDTGLVDGLVADADSVIHAAAESHVDRSIDDPGSFLRTNVLGTQVVLEAARTHDVRMLMLSTDEVYGPGDPGDGSFDESHPLEPASPYAASKAAADLLCSAYVVTYGAPVTIVRGTNAFGPRQIERVMPTFSICALEGRPVPVYGEGRQRREFLYVTDWARAALTVLDHGDAGGIYNIGDGFELENIELARRICGLAGAPESHRVRSPIPVTTSGRPALGAIARIGMGATGVVRRRARADRRVVPGTSGVAPRRASGPHRDRAPSGRCRPVRLVVTGAAGGLGRAFLAQVPPHHEIHALAHTDLDIGDRDAVMQTIPPVRPDAVLNFAALTHVDGCETDPARDTRDNALGPQHVALAARTCGAAVLHVSTDYVFDGMKGASRRDGRDASAVRVRTDEAGR
jgi:dTDP-glucose 4,6-dehydratase